MYLIDTNIISEVRKEARGDKHVSAWWTSIDDSELFLSVLVLGEIRKGVEALRAKDRVRAVSLDKWLEEVRSAFSGRILGVDQETADVWGRICSKRPFPAVDALLAATAIVNDLTLVTRNIADLTGCGAKLLNPFKGK